MASRLCLGHVSFPWYDAERLNRIEIARNYLSIVRPDRVDDFMHAFDTYRVAPEFHASLHSHFLSDNELSKLRKAVSNSWKTGVLSNECDALGRWRTNNYPPFDYLHGRYTEWVSRMVGEAVEPSFTLFLSYGERGVQPVHLDSPDSKWSLGICINSDTAWPIFCSRPIEWPPPHPPQGWSAEEVIRDPSMDFRKLVPAPSDAVLLSGNCQWHYRDPIASGRSCQYDILYLQYVPRGRGKIIQSCHWVEEFGIKELGPLHIAFEALRVTSDQQNSDDEKQRP